MSLAVQRPAYEEIPLFFESEGESVFGILTLPRSGDADTAVIVLPGGGTPLSVNRNRVSVRLCRDLAALGYAAFRMDYRGTGESTGTVGQWHLARPFVSEVSAAVDRLKDFGLERFALVGSTCFGSRTALAAGARIEEVEEVVALATPLRDFEMGHRHSMNAAMRRSLGRYALEALRPRTIRGLFDRRRRRIYAQYGRAKVRVVVARLARFVPRWSPPPLPSMGVSPHLVEAIERLVERGVPILFVYGADEDYYREFLAASERELAPVLERAGSSFTVVTVPGSAHGLVRIEVQDAVVDLILGWARTRRTGAIPAGVGSRERT